MRKILFGSLALAVLLAAATFAAGNKTKYLVIAPHTPESCLATLDDIRQNEPALLKKMDWGCSAGDHTGYLAVEAESDQAALQNLPEKTRAGARAVKLVKFSPEQIKQFHAGK